LNYFAAHDLPTIQQDGDEVQIHSLPQGLQFPFYDSSMAVSPENKIFLRKCNSTLFQIVDTHFITTERIYGGILFTGPQGNGKVSTLRCMI
jgi:hypothetical protein